MKAKKLKMRDMDSVLEYTENNPKILHDQTYNMLSKAWNKSNKISMVTLFAIELTHDEDLDQAILTIDEHEWEKALELGLKYYESIEDYEQCSKVNNLLISIKNN